MPDDSWKEKSKFQQNLLDRWLRGEIPFWPINTQYGINPNEACTPPKRSKVK